MTRIATSLPYTELEVATGNYDQSRVQIDRLVLHTMDGTWQGAAARFNNPASQVSAHYGVKADGGLIHWLEEYYTAYHAGDYAMNQRSIGIEHEDGGDYNGARPDSLYAASAALVRDICLFYNIPIDRSHILKHSEVSDAPTGCPDALDIDRIVAEASQSPSQPVDALAACLAQHTQLVDACNQKDAQIDGMNKQIAALNAQLAAKDGTVTSLQQQLDTLTAQQAGLQEQADQLLPLQKQLAQAEIDRTNANNARDAAVKALATGGANDYTKQPTSILINALLTRLADKLTGK